MSQSLDRFILDIPRMFIKQYPYIWFPLIVLWVWPPNDITILFLVIILMGLSMLQWQRSAWMSHMRREPAGADGKFYVDVPAVPLERAVRNISILVVGSRLLAFMLKGQFGLSFWQIFVLSVMVTLTYWDSQFFGAERLFIVPQNIDAFLEQLPYGYK